jgi:hypothetical protein
MSSLETDHRRSHKRRATWAAVPAAAALVAAAAVAPSAPLLGSDGADNASMPPAASVPSQATFVPSPDSPWLPRPWRRNSVQRLTLSAAAKAGDDFCGIAETQGKRPTVRQTLSDKGRVVRIYAIAAGDAVLSPGLFKQVYAGCYLHGPKPTPGQGDSFFFKAANGGLSAAVRDDAMVYLIASEPPAKGAPALDIRAVIRGLIKTVGRSPVPPECDDPAALNPKSPTECAPKPTVTK